MNGEGRPQDELGELSAMFGGAELAVVAPIDAQALAARRRRRRRGRWVALAVFVAIAAVVGTYIPLTLLAPLPAATLALSDRTITQPEARSFVMPATGVLAASLTGAEELTGLPEIFATNGGNEARPIASISKVITALVILDAKPLADNHPGPTITFDKADNDLYDKYYVLGATIARMRIGSTMTQRDALGVTLVASASNYAEAMANWAFGSPAGFRTAAAEWLAANGLTGTTMMEPTGFDPRNASTPTDLITIGRLAMAHPVVASLVQSPSLTIPGIDPVYNRNTILGQEGVNGIKTGTLEESGACLLFSAIVPVGVGEPITVVGVVLGGVDQTAVAASVLAFLESIRAASRPVQVATAGTVYGTVSTPWGEDVAVVGERDASLLIWSDTPITSSQAETSVTSVESGTVVATVEFTAGTRSVNLPLVAESAIAPPSDWWRLTHPDELLW